MVECIQGVLNPIVLYDMITILEIIIRGGLRSLFLSASKVFLNPIVLYDMIMILKLTTRGGGIALLVACIQGVIYLYIQTCIQTYTLGFT